MNKRTAAGKGRSSPVEPEKTRKYLSQSDVPSVSLEQAFRVPRAIIDEHAGRPTRPLDAAHAMKVQPSSGPFK